MHSDLRSVGIVGLGNVGVTAGYALLLERMVDKLVLVSRSVEKALGEKLDLEHGLPFLEPVEIVATDDYAALAGCDVVIVTAGAAQAPGETRLQLAEKNVAIVKEVIPKIVQHAPDSVIVMVSNPVDVLTYHATKIAGLPAGRILGSGTMLDTARYRFHLGEKLQIQPRSIHAYILGEHGDSSFPMIESAMIGGQTLSTFPGFSKELAMEAYEQTRQAAYQIIKAKGATYYAIGVVIMELVKTILLDKQAVLPVSTLLDNFYGESDVAVSVPCLVDRSGVKQVLQVQLSESEQAQFKHSCQVVREVCHQF